jgi:hypothetical protein
MGTTNRSGPWRRRAAVVGAAILVATVLQAIESPAANAAACGTKSNYHDGYYQFGASPVQLEGASAWITDQGGYVLCTTDTNEGTNLSTSWTMVVSGNGSGWAQSGTMYRWGKGSCVKHWAQQAQNSSSWGDYYAAGCSAVGETDQYWQQLVFVNGAWHVRSNMNTTIIRESSFNPLTSWTTPYGVEFDAETTYTASTVPGRVSAKQNYTSMQVQAWSDDSWMTTCGNTSLHGASDWSQYSFDMPGCDNVRTWNN